MKTLSLYGLEQHRLKAVAAAQAATAALETLSVRCLVTGSLARGTWGQHSDIDLLVTECPRYLRYAIEGIVEDVLGAFRFDLVYADELPQWKLDSFKAGAVHTSELNAKIRPLGRA